MSGPWWRQAWVAALAVGAFQVIGTLGASDNQPDRRPLDALAIALALVGPAGLALRRRWPLASIVLAGSAALVYLARGYAYGPIVVSVAFALFTGIRSGRRRATVALAAVGAAGYVVAANIDPHRDGRLGWAQLALVGGWLALVLAVSEVVRTRSEQRVERRRAEEEAVLRRADEQRMLLAQELHDVLAHHISMINVQASVALHLIDDQPEQVAPALGNIKEASRDALHQLRTALDLLRRGDRDDRDDRPREPAPGLRELPALVESVRAGGLEVRLAQDEPPEPVPAAVQLATYRIVQEALTNVTRHARAHRVDVRVGWRDGLDIEIVDDGSAGEHASSDGIGIAGMRRRAAALGGSLDAGALPQGHGFRVTAHLPTRPDA